MCHPNNENLYEKALLVAECDVTIAQIRRYKRYLFARMEDPTAFQQVKGRLNSECAGRRSGECSRSPTRSVPFPASRSDPRYGDFALLMTENWGSPGGTEFAAVRALPDIEKITKYETRIWSLRRRRFLQFLATKAGLSVSSPAE